LLLPSRQEARSQLQEPQVIVGLGHESVDVGGDDAVGHIDHQSQELQKWTSGSVQPLCRAVRAPPIVVSPEAASGFAEKDTPSRPEQAIQANFVV
jgi:hypothetical protein